MIDSLATCPKCNAPVHQKTVVLDDEPAPRPIRRVVRRVAYRPDGAALIFVFGLLGLLMCGVLGIAAWILSAGYERRCRQAGVSPESLATAGKILGIIATVFTVVQILFLMFYFGLFVRVY